MFEMGDLLKVTDANFDDEVLKSNIPVLVDLWAVWCGPCKMIEPIVDEISNEYAGKLKVGKLNVDENPQIATKYGVRSIPTLFLFKNGELKDQIVGAVPKKQIVNKVDNLLNA
jgi:thioredoxin 1